MVSAQFFVDVWPVFPQTVFSCRGSGGVGKDAGGPVPPRPEF